jgi:drug/metabolite transporter (DMT)-like permease
MKKGMRSFSAYQLASLKILISSVCLLPVALRNLSKFNKKNFFSILIIGFVGSAFANVIYYFLIRDTSPVVASVVEYFIPIVATLWGLSDN